jgi:hypothetical protein
MEYRRRVSRQAASWAALCHIEGESPPGWRDCEVIDISPLGLGVTFHHPQPWELVGRRISVDAPAIGSSVNLRLEGEIRNAAPSMEGGVRVGIEFVGLSKNERAIMAVLSEMSNNRFTDALHPTAS